jgi:hypothetical protein
MLAYNGSTNRRAMKQLAAQAIAVAPDDAARRHAERWANTFKRGHRLKVGSYPVKVYMEGNTPEIEADVESAFTTLGDDEA